MLKRLLLLCAALVCLAGCALWPGGGRLPGYSADDEAVVRAWKPRVWIAYYPYEGRGERPEGARPVPDYAGWTDNRMALDARRIRECGVHGVAVVLAPGQLASPDVLERLSRFAAVADEAGLNAALLLHERDAQTPLVLNAANLGRYLEGTALAELPAFGRGGRLSLFYDSSTIRLEGSLPADILSRPVSLRGLSEGQAVLVLRFGENGGCLQTAKRAQRDEWPVPRLQGRAWLRQVRMAAESGADEILLQSWNCYRDGSFAEPNALDGETMTALLRTLFADCAPME